MEEDTSVKPPVGPNIVPSIAQQEIPNYQVFRTEDRADLEGGTMLEVKRHLIQVFDDQVHWNYGSHLDGGFTDYIVWQSQRWMIFRQYGFQYQSPKGVVIQTLLKAPTENFHLDC